MIRVEINSVFLRCENIHLNSKDNEIESGDIDIDMKKDQ